VKMRTLLALLLIAVCCYSFELKEVQYQSLFTKWAVKHSKNYEMDAFLKRYAIFKQNVDFVNAHNAKNSSFEMEINHLADLTFEEFSAAYKGRKSGAIESYQQAQPLKATTVRAGASLDWRTKNAVNPIQDQGQCGSCYSFSGMASMEGAIAIKTGKLVKLSEQQVVDCSRPYGNEGCSGGFEKNVFTYARNGIALNSYYPYTGRDYQTCRTIPSSQPVYKTTSYSAIPSKNENALMTAVNIGPVSIAVEAGRSFQFYTRGVFDDPGCGVNLDHAINIVGYGSDAASGKDYWIVRNSWGTSWGENGYIRLVRSKNMCGLALDAIYPIV